MTSSPLNATPSLFSELDRERALARAEWVAACSFHELTESGVLGEVARRVEAIKRAAGDVRQAHPLVLLDLDSTLYEVGPRSHQILREWVESDESARFPNVRESVRRIEATHLGYSLEDTFSALGLSLDGTETEAAWSSAKKFWRDRFFTNEYLRHDHPYPGAVEFVRELHALGAEIVYLTGRDEPGMGDGTRKNLLRDGFPWQLERTHLIMKKAFELDDLLHKQGAARAIRNLGTLIASFENEPPNLLALQELFPEAMHVFVETVCSDRPVMPGRDLYRIRGFQR